MNKLQSGYGAVVITMLCCIGVSTFAQTSQEVDKWIKQLQSQRWQEREMAAESLIALPENMKTDLVVKALVDELELEFDKIQRGNFEKCLNCENGGEQGYYSWLFDAVSNMKDGRAFRLFMKIGSPTALVKYGDKGILAILKNVETKTTCNSRSASIATLSKYIATKIGSNMDQWQIREQVKKALINTLQESKHPDKNIEWYEQRASECAYIRKEIVDAFNYFAESGDKDVVPIIESLAKEDPYYRVPKGKPDDESTRTHDVRDEAQKILDRLKSKGIVK